MVTCSLVSPAIVAAAPASGHLLLMLHLLRPKSHQLVLLDEIRSEEEDEEKKNELPPPAGGQQLLW
jgi:hypothetical protein